MPRPQPPFTALLVCLHLALSVGLSPAQGGTDPRLEVSPAGQGSRILFIADEGGAGLRYRSHVPVGAVRVFECPPALALRWSEGPDRTMVALSVDGGRSFAAPRPHDHRLLLRFGHFDPLVAPPGVPPAQRDDGGRIHIVQHATPALEPYRVRLRSLGVRIHRHLAHAASIVRMDLATAEQVRALDFVRWVGPFHPAYRLSAELLRRVERDSGVATVNVVVFERGLHQKEAVAAFARRHGGEILEAPDAGYRMVLRLDVAALPLLAARDEVAFIDTWHAPDFDMDLARAFSGVLEVGPLGYDGGGVVAEVLDGGTDLSHPDFQALPPLVHGPITASEHGTSTFGQIFGSGAGNAQATGILPGAQGIVADVEFLGSRLAHTQELLQPPFEAVLQSNAWGSLWTMDYGTMSQELDDIVFHLDFLVLQSQGNLGSTWSRPEAWAKNVISVGGIQHLGTLDPSDDGWYGSASVGPAADGRIKPDLAHFNDGITTTSLGGAYTATFGGTSAAVSTTAGLCGAIVKMWADGIFANGITPGATVFQNRPHFATAKALAICAAQPWDFAGSAQDLARTHQGWGHVDLGMLYRNRHKTFVVNESDVLGPLQSTVWPFEVTPCEPRFRATLVYADPAGTVASTQHRINDLSLKVTAPSGAIYWGNAGLQLGNTSLPGGAPDTINTVENVWIDDPAPGMWVVEVIAAELNQDGHLETPALDADYALVVSGVRHPTSSTFSIDMKTCPGAHDLFIELANLPPQTHEGFTVLSSATALPPGHGFLLGIEPDAVLTWGGILSAPAPTNPLHFVVPFVPGFYPTTPLVLPPGSMAFFAGIELDVMGAALDAQGQLLGWTNVSRQSF